MESNYVDVIVKRRVRYMDILLRFLWIGATVWGTLFLLPINGMITIFYFFGNITLMFLFWNHYKLEYEYVYCDGQIDFDFVRNNSKRKHRLRVNLENAELLAPADSEKVLNYRNIDTVEAYVSHSESPRIYALIVKKQDKLMKILIEPNIKMLKLMRNKMPRKVDLREQDLARINEEKQD
ncbi:MAG: hypothetical protein E7262_10300 [Lachnospiraceae bacterium]|nr:hypothetical protein [Lachnospiraceae bacterium]